MMVELSSCKRNHMACKTLTIYYLILYRKLLLTPDLKPSGSPGHVFACSLIIPHSCAVSQ